MFFFVLRDVYGRGSCTIQADNIFEAMECPTAQECDIYDTNGALLALWDEETGKHSTDNCEEPPTVNPFDPDGRYD